MSNGIVNIHGKEYKTVAARLEEAHKESRLQGVKTEVLSFDPVVIKATINIAGIEYTGISSVATDANKSIEKQNPYEVAETSAVGRALAFAGYAGSEFPSADEMNKATTETREPVEEAPHPAETRESVANTNTFMMGGELKTCSSHEKPYVMKQGESKTKVDKDGNPKKYWYHDLNGKRCFGDGFMD